MYQDGSQLNTDKRAGEHSRSISQGGSHVLPASTKLIEADAFNSTVALTNNKHRPNSLSQTEVALDYGSSQ